MKHRHVCRALALLTTFILVLSSSVVSAKENTLVDRCDLSLQTATGKPYELNPRDKMETGKVYQISMKFTDKQNVGCL